MNLQRLTILGLIVLIISPLTGSAQSIEGIKVDDNGNVGVGTESPSYLLDAWGGTVHGATFRPKRGYLFPNREESSFQGRYKSIDYIFLLWDRNNGGAPFTNADRPQFFYWDEDDTTFRYLIDSGNMKTLEADLASAHVSNGVSIGTDSASAPLEIGHSSYGEGIRLL